MGSERLHKAASLFLYFFRIGWFTFGGGWSIVAQMQKDFVTDRQELSETELLDIVSVGRSLPGTMIGNVAYLFGFRQCGVLGGVFAVVGMITPSFILLSILTACYSAFHELAWVEKALVGVRSAVAPIIVAAALKLRKGAFPRPVCYALCAGACILSAVFEWNCVFIIVLGAAAGLLMGRWKGDASC